MTRIEDELFLSSRGIKNIGRHFPSCSAILRQCHKKAAEFLPSQQTRHLAKKDVLSHAWEVPPLGFKNILFWKNFIIYKSRQSYIINPCFCCPVSAIFNSCLIFFIYSQPLPFPTRLLIIYKSLPSFNPIHKYFSMHNPKVITLL